MMSALRAAGHEVVILTGADTCDQQTWDQKCAYLASLGLGECWDSLVLVPHDTLLAQAKADYLAANRFDVLIDNREDNLRVAAQAGVALCLLPWQTRQ